MPAPVRRRGGTGIAVLAAILFIIAPARAEDGNDIISASTLRNLSSTADHSRFEELKGPFRSGPEVTRACLKCHNRAGEQLKGNIHWTWTHIDRKHGKKLGKQWLINAFCTNTLGNEGMCAQCHAGFGRTSADFDLDKVENIDCLACHDRSGQYFRTVPARGHPKVWEKFRPRKPVPFTTAARNVGLPTRANCGRCHFNGGGGDNVKHGDLSSVLLDPPREVDVHMSRKGANLQCIDCHVGSGHEWSGSRYELTIGDDGKRPPGAPRRIASCAQCHGARPHDALSLKGFTLNNHTDRIACESCHIPAFARGGVATKVFWDWSSAGRLKDGHPYVEKTYRQGNGQPRPTYFSIKGDARWAENVRPVYLWTTGEMIWRTPEEPFDPARPVFINRTAARHDDPAARLMPFKIMRTVQPYDARRKVLVHMKLWGEDDDAFWGGFDFARAIAAGMKTAGRAYSGQYGFVHTRMLWPINHMVAPKEQALACHECHTRSKGGRLAALTGFYLPGRDRFAWLDMAGAGLGLLVLLAVTGHGLLRLVRRG